MNKVSIVLVRHIDESKRPGNSKFTSLKTSGICAAFYDPADSIIGENNFGVIYISQQYFKSFSKDEMYDCLYEYLSHELRHYFDNIIGVFDCYTELGETEIEKESEIFNYTQKDFLKKLSSSKDTELQQHFTLLRNICYITDPTEMNAFYHSLIFLLNIYKRENPESSEEEIKEFIKTQDYQAYELYNIHFIFSSKKDYKTSIISLFNDEIDAFFYYFYETLTTNKISKKTLDKFNNIFKKLYDHEKYDEEEFSKALKTFIEVHWIPFIYNKTYKHYNRIYKNINKYINYIAKT